MQILATIGPAVDPEQAGQFLGQSRVMILGAKGRQKRATKTGLHVAALAPAAHVS